jgi:hypothetical protein
MKLLKILFYMQVIGMKTSLLSVVSLALVVNIPPYPSGCSISGHAKRVQ